MRTPHSFTLLVSFVALPLAGSFLSGCVPYQHYADLKQEYAKAKKINDDITAKYNRLVQEYARLSGGSQAGGLVADTLKLQLEQKDQVIQALRQQIEGLEKNPAGAILPFNRKDVEAIGSGVTITPEGAIEIGEDLLFNSGVNKLKSVAAQQILDRIANVLKTNYPGEVFHIAGHTDNEPLRKTAGLWKTNQRLGYERAYTVFEYLNKEHAISESQMICHSFSFIMPTNPATANTKEGQARNRRVEIYRGGLKF